MKCGEYIRRESGSQTNSLNFGRLAFGLAVRVRVRVNAPDSRLCDGGTRCTQCPPCAVPVLLMLNINKPVYYSVSALSAVT